MSNPTLTFCSVVTALTTLSVLNISSANALTQANQVRGNSDAVVTSDPRGVNRTFTTDANANASSPKSVNAGANSSLNSTPTTAEVKASSFGEAGNNLKGSSEAFGRLTGQGTGPTDLKITASGGANAKVTGATNGLVTAGVSANLNSRGGVAGGVTTFSGMR